MFQISPVVHGMAYRALSFQTKLPLKNYEQCFLSPLKFLVIFSLPLYIFQIQEDNKERNNVINWFG